MNNPTPTNLLIKMNGPVSRKVQSISTHRSESRQSEQAHIYARNWINN